MDKELKDQKEIQRILNAKDLYHVLSVADDCTDQEVLTSAYKSISTKVHPEINKEENAIDAFKRVSHAYQVLTDQKKRNQYSMQLEKEKSTKNKKNEKENKTEEEDEDEIDPFDLYLQYNPDPTHKFSITDIISYILFGLVILQMFFGINPIHIFNQFFFNPLNRDEIRSVISFDPLPDNLEFESQKGVPFYIPLSWIENVAQKTGINDEESLGSIRPIADQIYAEILEEKCELEKNSINSDQGKHCEIYYSFIGHQ
ncbi:DnaJ, subfamily C member 18 [Tritrichomonas musculus]|uniref:DnaJ, subfamily C member 18 n=1 Tax=Tritrichomonas musculus TaxID=1915356 RepID=A0ABR2HMX7_9EUKA